MNTNLNSPGNRGNLSRQKRKTATPHLSRDPVPRVLPEHMQTPPEDTKPEALTKWYANRALWRWMNPPGFRRGFGVSTKTGQLHGLYKATSGHSTATRRVAYRGTGNPKAT